MKSRDTPTPQLAQEKELAARLSLGSNLTLLIVKLAVGFLTGSVSVLSEAAHSASDLFASILAVVSVRVVDMPPDEEHPYGHGKAEGISTLAQGVLLSLVASYIIYESVKKLSEPHETQHMEWGMVVMAASALINIFVVRFVLRIAKKTNSLALIAVSKDHMADIYAAIGVLIGLVLVRVTGKTFFDPIMAIAVALLIFRSAWHLFSEATHILMDTNLPPEDVERVRQILEDEPKVLGYHKIRTRQAGSVRHVDAHILLDDNSTLLEAHDLTEEIEDRIRAILPGAAVLLHTEPYHAEQEHQIRDHGTPAQADTKPKRSRTRT
ncbi:cation transporter [bacterium]|nr:MAG: cation transporter [bacterium]